MPDLAAQRTIAALQHVIEEMQHLVEHPRIQQKTWVASGQRWLPVLNQAKEDLARMAAAHDTNERSSIP